MGLANEVAHFILQRERARVNHDLGNPTPWCADPVINQYRFCNVRREDDKVTRWLKKHWRDPYWKHKNFVPAMILARMVNWPPTLEAIGFPETWSERHIVQTINRQKMLGKAWTGAYVITTCGQAMDKALYVVQTAGQAVGLPPYHPGPDLTLQAVWTSLRGHDGLGAGFIAAQVVADLKNTPLLADAPDWWTWAAPGPGSRRGINRYFGLALKHHMGDDEWLSRLHEMIDAVTPMTGLKLHAQDWQNVMCEFDKWQRAKRGEGRPRSLYRPDNSYDI